MNDQEIEAQLHRYRPAGQPSPYVGSAFRRTVARSDRRLAWQLVAAAVLLLAATLLHSATARLDNEIAAETGAAAVRAAEQAYVEELTRQLGDDPNARLMAEAIVASERRQSLTNQEIPQ